MKKIYCKPTTEIIEIGLTSLLAQSFDIYNSNSGGDDGKGGYDPENSLSRENNHGGSIWESQW